MIMTMKENDILLKEATEAMKGVNAPKVDVVDRVMDNLPDLVMVSSKSRLHIVKRVSIAAAACLLLAVGINLSILFTHQVDEYSLGNTTAMVYDYNSYSDGYSNYESAAYFELDFQE